MEGGLDRLGLIPGVELGPGVESPLGVGVLDFSPGVPALSRYKKKKRDNLKCIGNIQLMNNKFICPSGLSNSD